MLLVLAHFFLLADLFTSRMLPPPAATTRPAQQTTVVTTTSGSTVANPPDLFDTLGHTKVGQWVEGKQTITLHDMLQPSFWIDTIKDLVITVIEFIPRLLVSLLFLLIFWVIYRIVRRVLNGAMQRANVDSSIRDLLITLSRWAIMGFGLVIACNQVGIPIVAMLTGVSILGLAVGFAAQETLANFIAGVVIFWDKPFKAQDWLTIADSYAQVQRITFRSCRLLNLDGEMIIFPNTFMLANKVANHTTHPVSRVNIAISIAYEASITAARAALLRTVEGDYRIRHDPRPEVVVDKLNDSSVDLILRFWIADEKIERKIWHEYNEKAKCALDAASVDIPYPHVHLVREKPALLPNVATSAAPGAPAGHS
jgi:small conductance mechanosensitive channel